MIRRCLIVDTETTGLDPTVDKLIEVGAVLYSVENRTSLASFATLLKADANPAEPINRIPAPALSECASALGLLISEASAFEFLRCLRGAADAVVCHNVEFDQPWFSKDQAWQSLPWLCTAFDFAWPAATREAGSLIHLALEHGIGVSSAHRALTDCNLIAALFDRMSLFGCDLQQMFTRASRPKAIFQAIVPFEEKDKAKDAGFKWNGERKQWTRRMAVEDAAALPFKVLRLRDC